MTEEGAEAGLPRISPVLGDVLAKRWLLDIEPGLSWFRGHFPGRPVLPGIVQVHWAVMLATDAFGFEHLPVEIKRLKFTNVVVPPATLELSVMRSTEHEISFVYSSAGRKCSEGRLIFGESSQ